MKLIKKNFMNFVNLLLDVALLFNIICLIRKNKKQKELINKTKDENKKLILNNEVIKDWLSVRQSNTSIIEWFIQNNINKIAVYGYGILGKALIEELKGSCIEIVCLIDKNYQNIYTDILTVSPDRILECDAIIVTAINYYDEIEAELQKKCLCPIISIEDVIYGVGYKFEE